MNNILSTSLLSLFVAVHGVQAQVVTTCNNFGHFDLYIDVEPPASDGGSLIIDSSEQFSVEASTGRAIVLANFGDFPGGPHKTDDPGWVVSAGDLLGGEFLWFRALGSLRFWDKDQQRWLDNPPNEARVRYFGAIPPEVVINGTDEENAFYAQGTIWSADGVEGPIEAPIEQAADIETGDAIHAHLDFCVEDSAGDCTIPQVGFTGSPAIGAYLIEIQLFSNAVSANGQQKYFDSPPIKVLLNNGLVAEECTSAIGALVVPDTVVDDSEALPAAGVLIMSGP
ncbi:MAG: hypothetical protein ACPG3T_01315 [Pseudomonadales bacterium]